MIAKMTAASAAAFMNVHLQAVHKQIKTKELVSFKNQNRVYFYHDTAKTIFNLSIPRKILSFQIVKGGTGKTSLATSFAIRANLYGLRVLCIDLDQQANMTHAFSVDSSRLPVMIDVIKKSSNFSDCIVNITSGLDLFPSRIENAVLDNAIMLDRCPIEKIYTQLLEPVLDNYDVIVFDSPPALGYSVAASTMASDLIISPVTPEQFGLSGLKITYDEVQLLNKNYNKEVQMKIVLNKFDSRTALFSEVLRTILNDLIFKDLICNSLVRTNQEFPNTVFEGTNIYNSLKNTSAKEDVDLLVREILQLDQAYKNRKNKNTSA